MKNIVLTGFMGTGKSEVGRVLSELLGMRLVDTDREIEQAEGMTISEIFDRHGEAYFRKIELEVIKRVSSLSGVIISTGGGAVLQKDNIKSLQSGGTVFCLVASAETILIRTEAGSDRPLLKCEDRYEKISEMLKLRRPFYEKAGIIIDTENRTPIQVAEEIIGKLPWKK